MNVEAWWFVLSPVTIAFAGGVAALILDGWDRRVVAIVVTIISALVAAGASAWLASGSTSFVLADVLLIDPTIYAVWALIFGLSALSTLGGAVRMSRLPAGGGVSALVAFLSAGSALISASVDLLLIVILIEVLAVVGYGLTASIRTSGAKEAALKYFIQGSVATGLFVLGLALAFGLLGGSTEIAALGEGTAQAPVVALIVSLLILSAFALKLGAFPFHSWAPDVYQGAHPAGASLIVVVPKIGALSAMFLIAEVLMRPLEGSQTAPLQPTLLFSVLAIASIIFGNLGALRQSDFGRMLGYSAVAQAGYALIALAVGLITYPGAMLLMTVYGLAASTAFAVAGALRAGHSSWDGSIRGMSGLAASRPWLAASLAVSMLSLTGIPLFAGFWGKLSVFGLAAAEGFIFLTVAGVLGSVFSFAYYGAVIRTVYFDQPSDTRVPDTPTSPTEALTDTGVRYRALPGVASVVGAGVLVIIGVVPLFIGLTPLVRFFGIGG